MEKNIKSLLEKAIELDPSLASAHYKLGILYQTEENFASALSCFEKACSPRFSLSGS